MLKKIHKPEINPHTILSSIYVEQGNIEEARTVLQNNLLNGLADMYSSCSMLGATYYNSNKNILKEHIDTSIANIQFKRIKDNNRFMEIVTELRKIAKS